MLQCIACAAVSQWNMIGKSSCLLQVMQRINRQSYRHNALHDLKPVSVGTDAFYTTTGVTSTPP